jgi:hypothetical protein
VCILWTDHSACRLACDVDPRCQAWTLNLTSFCLLYDTLPTRNTNSTVSGVRGFTSGFKRDPMFKVKLVLGTYSRGGGMSEVHVDDIMYMIPSPSDAQVCGGLTVAVLCGTSPAMKSNLS